jgi:hypothetical protein
MPWIRDEAVAAVVDRMDQFGSSVDEFLSLDQDSVSRLMIALAELDGPQPVLLMGFLAELPGAQSIANIAPLLDNA